MNTDMAALNIKITADARPLLHSLRRVRLSIYRLKGWRRFFLPGYWWTFAQVVFTHPCSSVFIRVHPWLKSGFMSDEFEQELAASLKRAMALARRNRAQGSEVGGRRQEQASRHPSPVPRHAPKHDFQPVVGEEQLPPSDRTVIGDQSSVAGNNGGDR